VDAKLQVYSGDGVELVLMVPIKRSSPNRVNEREAQHEIRSSCFSKRSTREEKITNLNISNVGQGSISGLTGSLYVNFFRFKVKVEGFTQAPWGGECIVAIDVKRELAAQVRTADRTTEEITATITFTTFCGVFFAKLAVTKPWNVPADRRTFTITAAVTHATLSVVDWVVQSLTILWQILAEYGENKSEKKEN